VIVALPAAQHSDILWVLDHCRQDGVSYSMVPDLFELRLSHVNLETVSGIPLLGFDESNIAGWNLFVKPAKSTGRSARSPRAPAPLFSGRCSRYQNRFTTAPRLLSVRCALVKAAWCL
jgi:hypothetical protein